MLKHNNKWKEEVRFSWYIYFHVAQLPHFVYMKLCILLFLGKTLQKYKDTEYHRTLLLKFVIIKWYGKLPNDIQDVFIHSIKLMNIWQMGYSKKMLIQNSLFYSWLFSSISTKICCNFNNFIRRCEKVTVSMSTEERQALAIFILWH